VLLQGIRVGRAKGGVGAPGETQNDNASAQQICCQGCTQAGAVAGDDGLDHERGAPRHKDRRWYASLVGSGACCRGCREEKLHGQLGGRYGAGKVVALADAAAQLRQHALLFGCFDALRPR
jgi:hypothetical protein